MPRGVPNKRYTAEFKKMVVETMMEEKLNYRETARRFEINDHKRVMAWELKKMDRTDKYKAAKAEITAIYHENKGRYGYRRIKAKLKGLPPALHRQQALSAA